MKPTRLKREELFPDKLPNSFLNRAIGILDFIDEVRGNCLDVGERSPMTEMLEKRFNINVGSTHVDLDREIIPRCNTLFCFEVLEHLYNPLFFLENISADIIYISTPYQRPQILKAIHHFHEIPTDRLMWLFDEAGLDIIKETKVTIAGNWYEHIYGFRPILRYIQKTRVYKLCKK